MIIADGRNIVLAGFMGTGKTAVGRLVAARLGRPFVDTDAEVEAAAGRTIATIFATDGEAAFRGLEAAACLRAAAIRGQVIAVGGGALLDPRSRAALEASGLLICLTAPLDEIVRRVGLDASRPLAGGRDQLERLYASRAAVYASLPYQVDTAGKNPAEVAGEIIELWRSGS